MNSYNTLLAAAALLLGIVETAHGQASAMPTRDSSEANELLMIGSPIVITGAQTLQYVGDSPVSMSVITEDEIRKSGLTTVPDLLRSLPGLDVIESGRAVQNVVIRGFNGPFAGNLLVMINGQSIYQDSFGGTFWQQEPLLISQIKQIEVVRGPGSVLYGANAFGGVINIITKTPQEMAKEGSVSTFDAVGDEHSQVEEMSVSGATRPDGKGLAYTVGAGFHGTQGIGDLQKGQLRDSYALPMYTFRGVQPVSGGSIDLSAAYAYGKTDLVTPFTDYVDATTRTNRISAAYVDDRDHLTVNARTYATAVAEPDGSAYEESAANEFSIQATRRPTHRHEDVFGASYRTDDINSSLMGYSTHAENLVGLYGQDEYQASSNTNLFTGLRIDHNSLFGTTASPRVSVVRHVSPQQTLRLSYSSAFQDPTLFLAYYNSTFPDDGLMIHVHGNTNADPQKINSVEMGYHADTKTGYVDMSVFHDTITDILTLKFGGYIMPPGFPFPVPTSSTTENSGSGIAEGFEIDSKFAVFKHVNARVNYSYLNTQLRGGQAQFSPRNHINVSLDSALSRRLTAYAAMHFVDSEFENAYTLTRQNIPSYIDVDTKLGYKLNKTGRPWEIAVAATNVFNVPHIEMPIVSIYGQPSAAAIPRRAWLELSGGW